MRNAIVIGAGPAGLMAAEMLAKAGCKVTVFEGRPSVGRKFLMAGKSGLNLTMDEPIADFLAAFDDRVVQLTPMLRSFDNVAVQGWARDLDQQIFTGTSGRVFPKAMKASPLLRAWLIRLADLGVEIRTGWRWTGFGPDGARFETASGPALVEFAAAVLACGGASWQRLGSDGAWADILTGASSVVPFAPANVGLAVPWSAHMAPVLGQPLKGVRWQSGRYHSNGEAVLTANGLEGGGVYAVSRGVREGNPLLLDLRPDLSLDKVCAKLNRPRGKASLTNFLRKALRLDPAKLALLQELGRPLPQDPVDMAAVIKHLEFPKVTVGPLDGAISVAGGLSWDGLDDHLMIKQMPGIFAAGEMLDWEAPTGGYLISACLATGRWAGQAAAKWINAQTLQ